MADEVTLAEMLESYPLGGPTGTGLDGDVVKTLVQNPG